MPIETICQGCARKLRVPDEHAGKKARCPQCGMIYVVPGSPDAISPAADDTPAQPTAESSSQGSSLEEERWQMRAEDGRVYGPVSKGELDQWYSEGRVPASAVLLREGDSQWQKAAQVYPRLGGGRRQINEQHNPFADSPVTRPYASPRTRSRPQAAHRGGLILTLGILGWAICPVFGPFAWAMGNSDLREMRMGRMDPTGQGLTQAGMILGIIQTALIGLGIFFMCLGSFA